MPAKIAIRSAALIRPASSATSAALGPASGRPVRVALGGTAPSERSARMSPGSTSTDAPPLPMALWIAPRVSRTTWSGWATVSQKWLAWAKSASGLVSWK